jgi:hypothetical protein
MKIAITFNDGPAVSGLMKFAAGHDATTSAGGSSRTMVLMMEKT